MCYLHQMPSILHRIRRWLSSLWTPISVESEISVSFLQPPIFFLQSKSAFISRFFIGVRRGFPSLSRLLLVARILREIQWLFSNCKCRLLICSPSKIDFLHHLFSFGHLPQISSVIIIHTPIKNTILVFLSLYTNIYQHTSNYLGFFLNRVSACEKLNGTWKRIYECLNLLFLEKNDAPLTRF